MSTFFVRPHTLSLSFSSEPCDSQPTASNFSTHRSLLLLKSKQSRNPEISRKRGEEEEAEETDLVVVAVVRPLAVSGGRGAEQRQGHKAQHAHRTHCAAEEISGKREGERERRGEERRAVGK